MPLCRQLPLLLTLVTATAAAQPGPGAAPASMTAAGLAAAPASVTAAGPAAAPSSVTAAGAPPTSGPPALVFPPTVGPAFQGVADQINREQALGPQVRLTGISIDRAVARMTLAVTGQEVVVTVRPVPDHAPAGPDVSWFDLSVDAPEHQRLLARLRPLLTAALPEDPRIARRAATWTPRVSFTPLQHLASWWLLLLLAGALVLVSATARRRRRAAHHGTGGTRPDQEAGPTTIEDWSRSHLVALALLLVAAFLLRWLLPYHTLLHENHESYALNLGAPWPGALFLPGRGSPSAYLAVVWLVDQLLGLGHGSFFLVGTLLSTAAVGGLFVFTWLLSRSLLAAWTTGVLLALQPVALALAPSEEPLVFTAGLVLCGLPLVLVGARDRRALPLLCGTLLVCLGAATRELTLPLSLCVPLVLLAALPSPRQLLRWPSIGALLLCAAALLPQALAFLLSADERSNVQVEFIGRPLMMFDRHWAGWQVPYVPAWMAWAAVGALVLVIAHALVTRRWRPAVAAVGCYLVAQLAAGVVTGGYFPSHLRHHALALALMLVPVGIMVGVAGAWARRHTSAWRVGYLVAPLAGSLALVVTPASYRWDVPVVREHRFLAATVPRLARRAVAVVHERHDAAPKLGAWLRTVHPQWRIVSTTAWQAPRGAPPPLPATSQPSRSAALPRAPGHDAQRRAPVSDAPPQDPGGVARVPTYFFIDLGCLASRPPGTSRQGPQPLRPSPYGGLQPACHRVLQSTSWIEVARQPVRFDRTLHPPRADFLLPSGHGVVAILEARQHPRTDATASQPARRP